ncbi:hypothetical protein SBA5_100078 [Candidatus Sulfotelmatomonas gaucii]|uniref:Uncharacterized protein n=1 Tax=Candidatus Sulfuritelmatomonas gaucii TaxID=2043161 RepID=A0A2N9L2K5_9BACT|nr:hypothetical protein SBA5_100078 [Candidatus Sulfotelmatomonas gaucii]
MSIHLNLNSLTVEAIEEYLAITKYCVETRKNGGGIYGYPATLLLFCVIDAIGNGKRAGKEPFRILKEAPFNCRLNDAQIKTLETWYRNPLAHEGMIAPGVCLSPEESGDAFAVVGDEPVQIRVKTLYNLVRAAWDQIDKSTLKSNWGPRRLPKNLNPTASPSATASVQIAVTGSLSQAQRGASSATEKP